MCRQPRVMIAAHTTNLMLALTVLPLLDAILHRPWARRGGGLTRMMSPTTISRHASGVSVPPRSTFTMLLLI